MRNAEGFCSVDRINNPLNWFQPNELREETGGNKRQRYSPESGMRNRSRGAEEKEEEEEEDDEDERRGYFHGIRYE